MFHASVVTFMMKLLLGIVVEIFVAVSVAGGVLALLIPALRLSDAVGERDRAVIAAVVGVLIVSVAVALFRPRSAIRRYAKR